MSPPSASVGECTVAEASRPSIKASATAYDTSIDPGQLWYIHGHAYDLTSFMQRHPGGSEALATCRGRDITSLFESYHSFRMDKARAVLNKLEKVKLPPKVLAEHVVDLSQGNWWYSPSDGKPDAFWATLIERSAKVLREKEVDTNMGWGRFFFAMSVLALQPLIYAFGYLHPSALVSTLSALVLAVTFFVGTQVAHDAGHFALSHTQWVNNVLYVYAAFGWTNCGLWQTMHQVHHMETNEESRDPDMFHYFTWVRYFPSFPHNMWMYLQTLRLYCYIVWSFSVVGLLVIEPIELLLTGSAVGNNGPNIDFPKHDPFRRGMLWAHLLAFPLVMLGLPIYLDHVAGRSSLSYAGMRLGLFIFYLYTAGLFLGILSQVNHFNEKCVDAANKNASWAQRQVETSANFAGSSTFWCILSGGFNLQIEHHLFPQVCTDKLPYLVPVVKATCEEFGIEYKEYDGMSSILASTHRYMASLAAPNKAKAA